VGTVAFAFEGGGSYGAAQVGMLTALLEAGITPDLVVGTSVGAFNAAMLAARTDFRRSLDEMERMWRSIRRRDVLPVRPYRAMSALMGRRRGLVPNDGLGRVIDRWLPVTRLEDLALPFAAVATDIVSGQPVVMRSGLARHSLLASSALPGVYPPVRVEGRDLVDGGLVANFPVDVAANLGATLIYALPTAVSAPSRLSGPFALLQRASDVLVERASRRTLDATGGAVSVAELPAPSTERSMFDFSDSVELMQAGYDLTRTWLPGAARAPAASGQHRASSVAARIAFG
jgi:NTE family protein